MFFSVYSEFNRQNDFGIKSKIKQYEYPIRGKYIVRSDSQGFSRKPRRGNATVPRPRTLSLVPLFDVFLLEDDYLGTS